MNYNSKTSILKKNNGKEATNRSVVEIKMVKSKNLLKVICLILVMVVMTTTLTGCVSLALGEGVGLKVENGDLKDAGTGADVSGFGIVLHAAHQDVDTISNPDKIYGLITVTRQLPLFLFHSVLAGHNSDNLATAPALGGATLDPESVLTNTVNSFTDFISAGATIATNFQHFSLCILLCMWALNFVGIVVNEKFTMEALLKGFMQFICGALLVESAGTIVVAFNGMGVEAMGLVGDAGTTIAESFSGLHDSIHDTFLDKTLVLAAAFDIKLIDPFVLGAIVLDIESVMVVILLAVPFYLQIKLAFKIISVVLTRSLELFIRVAFAPIPLAFASSNGFGPETIRYFRSTMACALQPALMMAGCVAIEPMVASINTVFGFSADAVVPGVLSLCAAYIVISTYFGETKQLAHSIIGG